jgi:hypothetical protein
MTTTARGLLQAELLKSNGVPLPQSQLPRVLEEIKKIYPQRFKQTTTNPNAKRGAGVEKGGGKKVSRSKTGLQRSDLDADEAKHFDQFVDMGMDPDKLLKSIERNRK